MMNPSLMRGRPYQTDAHPVTLRERLQWARARVQDAEDRAKRAPWDAVYAVALESRRRELADLEALARRPR